MRKVLVALAAIVTLALAGSLIAAPKIVNNGQQAASASGFDILSLTHPARDLPDQAYPAH